MLNNIQGFIRGICICLVATPGLMCGVDARAQDAATDEVLIYPEPRDPDFFRSSRDGWFWLNDPTVNRRKQAPEAQVPPTPEVPLAKPRSSKAPELKAHEDLQRAVDDALKVAYIDPSEENLKRYLALWQLVVRKASVFSDLAQQTMWKHPELDATVADGVRPTNPVAMDVFDEEARNKRDSTLRELAGSYGLWFFFDSSCGVCRVYAPLLKSFQLRYGFSVLAISRDGSSIAQFPDARPDNGVAKELGVTDSPQTFLVNPRTRDILHLGTGAMSAEELADRAIQILKYKQAQISEQVTQLANRPRVTR